MSSAIPGFFKLSIQERQDKIKALFGFAEEEIGLLSNSQNQLTLEIADSMIENCVALHSTPIGVATNFIVDGKEILVPMANEEPSVIAGASLAAKLCRSTGGFQTACGMNVCSGQIVMIVPEGENDALEKAKKIEKEIIEISNSTMPSMVKRGGGVCGIDYKIVNTKSAQLLVIEIHVNVCEAMGANCVNHACEVAKVFVSENLGYEPLMGILTNLSNKRIVHAQAKWPIKSLQSGAFPGMQVAQRIIMAAELAAADEFRATTHRKGIMNGVTAVVLATGNDTRAVEAAAHSYATTSGNLSLTKFRIDDEMNLVGEIWIPMPVGVVGGTIKRDPAVLLMRKMLRAETADDLARTIASVGLASNFAALRALVTNGICAGHMKLHSRNIACEAGAKEKDIDFIAEKLIESGDITVTNAVQLICNLI